jgi:hypothetical protein
VTVENLCAKQIVELDYPQRGIIASPPSHFCCRVWSQASTPLQNDCPALSHLVRGDACDGADVAFSLAGEEHVARMGLVVVVVVGGKREMCTLPPIGLENGR